ncbi:hypothetical protein MBLNU457_1839t2 [Dothideomycetes sp. NU457]
MEVSQTYEVTQQHLYIQWAHSLAPAYTFPLDGLQTKNAAETSTIQWSASSTHVILLAAQGVHIFSILDTAEKIHISNGSGSLGKIIAVEIIGDAGREQAVVVFEFGRVNFWDLSTGRSAEIGEAKMGGRGNPWSVRRVPGKTEVLALLSRVAAQDVLSLFLTNSTTPFRSVTLPSVDAQSISWSPCGQWLAVLDSSLASPSVYISTADGYLFRSYPARLQATPPSTPGTDEKTLGLGFRSMAWTSSALALCSTQTITLLDNRTFSFKATMSIRNPSSDSASLSSATFGYQETLTSTHARSYTYLTGTSLPKPSAKTTIADPSASPNGAFLATRDEAAASSITIWSLEQRLMYSTLQQHVAVRKMLWHPDRANLLLILSDDGSLYLWDVGSGDAPVYLQHAFSGRDDVGRVNARWVAAWTADPEDDAERKLAIIVTSRKSGWQVVWPEGREAVESLEGDVSQDSLYDILTGRTPLPGDKMRDVEEDGTRVSMTGLDDTFRDKVIAQAQDRSLVDLQNDSEIF